MRVAAAGGGEIEERLFAEELEQIRAGRTNPLGVAAKRQTQHVAGPPLRRRPARQDRRDSAIDEPSTRAASAISVAGDDDLFQEELLELAAAIELDQRVVVSPRGGDRIVLHRAEQFAELFAPLGGQRKPGGQRRVAIVRDGVEFRRADGGQLPQPADRGQQGQVGAEPIGLGHQFEVGRLAPGVQGLALEAVVGRVAVDHVFIGRAEQVVRLVVGRFVFLFVVLIRHFVLERLVRGRFRPQPFQFQRRHAEELFGVGLDVIEELSGQGPAVFGGRRQSGKRGAESGSRTFRPTRRAPLFVFRFSLSLFRFPLSAFRFRFFVVAPNVFHPAEGQEVERRDPVGQRNLRCLAEPVDQQGHRCHQVVVLQQGIHQRGIGPGRAELLGVLAPEGDVSGRRPGAVPGGQGLGHLLGRLPCLAAGEALHLADLTAGELVPPAGQGGHPRGDLLEEVVLAGRGRLALDLGVQGEQLVEQVDQTRRSARRERCLPRRGICRTGRRSRGCSKGPPGPRTRSPGAKNPRSRAERPRPPPGLSAPRPGGPPRCGSRSRTASAPRPPARSAPVAPPPRCSPSARRAAPGGRAAIAAPAAGPSAWFKCCRAPPNGCFSVRASRRSRSPCGRPAAPGAARKTRRDRPRSDRPACSAWWTSRGPRAGRR